MPIRILIVDKAAASRGVVRKALESEEIECQEAACGEDALERIAAGFEPDLVVCDVKMPRGDGPWLVERLLADRPGPRS